METKKRIEFSKDVTQPISLKKKDRLIVSGPVELEIYEVTVAGSLDYEIKAVLSMPRTNEVVKIKPHHLQSNAEIPLVYKETNQRH